MEKLHVEHCYMKAALLFEKPPAFTIDGTQLQAIVTQALQSLHGQVGASVAVDVLTCRQASVCSANAILRVPQSELAKVWSALTLLGSYGGAVCTFQVEKVSGSLMSLAVDSRRFDFITAREE